MSDIINQLTGGLAQPIATISIIIQIMSIVLYIMSVQFKKKKSILITQIGASLCYLITYAIQGYYAKMASAWSGVAIEVVEEVKDVAFIKVEDKKGKVPMPYLILFLAVLIAVSIYFYAGPISLIPLFINILYFVSTYFKNPYWIRFVMLINACLWIIFNIAVGAYVIVGGNVLEIISATISLIRFKDERKKGLV